MSELIIALLAGAVCGFLNTLASSGSAVTLPVLMFMGLSPVVANAYKNLVLAVTSAMAVALFALDGHIDWTIGLLMGLGSVAGAYLGAKLAMHHLAKIWAFRLLVTIIILELINMTLNYFHVAIVHT